VVGLCLCVCVSVYLCVCLLVTFVSPAKTAEPIEMPFEGLTQVGPKNHVLDGSPDSPREWGNFGGCLAYSKALAVSAAVFPAKGFVSSSITVCMEKNHSILNNCTTCVAAFRSNSLTTYYYYYYYLYFVYDFYIK